MLTSSFIPSLLKSMEAKLHQIQQEPNQILALDQSINIITGTIEQLKEFITQNPFPGPLERQHYFRYEAPQFFQHYFFCLKVYQLEIFKLSADKERTINRLTLELDHINSFFLQHQDFVYYYYSRYTLPEPGIFDLTGGTPLFDDLTPFVDRSICSIGSYRASWVQANERLKKYMVAELEHLHSPHLSTESSAYRGKWAWNVSISDAIELIYALHASQALVYQDGPADLKHITDLFQDIFQISLTKVYDRFSTMRNRKKSRLPFLDRLKVLLLKRMDEMG
jgi:hypothetical protein